MAQKFINFFRSLIPLGEEKRKLYFKLCDDIGKSNLKGVKKLLKQKKVEIKIKTLEISPQILENRDYLYIKNMTFDSILSNKLLELNEIIYNKKIEESYIEFSKNAKLIIPKFIAMNINDYDDIKYAITLQLFSIYTEPIHILLIGDKDVGKTNLLRSVTTIHKNTKFGSGKGSMGQGFCITVKGDEVTNGLIADADKGICTVEKINQIKGRDMELLFSAMDEGHFEYEDKNSNLHKFSARISLLASMDPKEKSFVGWTIETLKKQILLSDEMLSKFHLIFMIRKKKVETSDNHISRKIVFAKHEKILSADETFISNYIEKASHIDVEIPNEFNRKIVELSAQIKLNEKKYLVDVSSKLLIGLQRMLKSSARMRLSKEVNEDDYLLVKQIVLNGLKLYN